MAAGIDQGLTGFNSQAHDLRKIDAFLAHREIRDGGARAMEQFINYPHDQIQLAVDDRPCLRYGDPRKVDPIVEELRVVAGALNTTPAQVALAWLLGRDEIATVIVGASSEAQLTANLQAAGLTLPQEHREQLDRVSRPDVPYPHWMQRFHDKDRF